jgi:hypothetical protein
MHTCPHCLSATISNYEKWLSDPITPATCCKCGGLSYIERKSKATAGLGVIAIGVVGVWISAYVMSFYPLIATVVLSAVWFYSIWHPAPLVKTDINKVAGLMANWVVSFYVFVLMGIAWFIYFKIM